MGCSLRLLVLISIATQIVAETSERRWISVNPSTSLPTIECHVGGYEDSENYKGLLYIGRSQVGNELAIGKVILQSKSGYFPNVGVEHHSDRFEILCGGTVQWIPKQKEEEMKDHLIQGGVAGNGDPLYICRGVIDGQITPGKFYEPTGCCYVPIKGREHCAQDYSLMTEVNLAGTN